MPQIYDYDKQDYPVLLAAQDIDASDGALFAEEKRIEPNKTDRTIFIGLGGMGVNTIDYIKGAIIKRLDATWSRYIAFFGIDSAYTEFDRTKYLQKSETVLTTLSGVDMRRQSIKDYKDYPEAWRPFAKPEVMKTQMQSMFFGRKRLVGKLKIHDKNPEGAVDMDVVSKLARLKADVLDPVAAPGNYEVYVIGSVCGGTCSGAFLEMPSLVRKALNCNNVHIYAMLYLPDTLTSLDPANAAALMANGYASLKELNYYQGVSMRPGYPESFSYNDPAAPTLKVGEDNKPFYDIPYLIGASADAAARTVTNVRQNVAEYLIVMRYRNNFRGYSFLWSDFTDKINVARHSKRFSYYSLDREETGTYHEFPKHFGAIGFAQTAAPKKIVRSYVVSQACTEAGLKPVSSEKRAEQLAGNPNMLLPFRGDDDLINANEGTQKATEIVAPLSALLQVIHSADFSFLAATGWSADGLWQRLSRHEYEAGGMPARIEAAFNERTNTLAMQTLETAIANAYKTYLENVRKFVSEEGPLAFYNLFVGRFLPVNGNHGTGIETMLRNIQSGNIVTGAAYNWDSVATTKSTLDMRDKAVVSAGLLHRNRTANEWLPAYDAWQKSRIIEARREYALGDTGKFHEKVLWPATVLAQRIQAFGYLLASMSDIYKKHGHVLEDFREFSKAKDNEAEINLCAVSADAHAWLKKEAKAQLQAVDARKLRAALVDSFFSDIEGWSTIPDNVVTKENGVTKLAREGVAIPARKKFDEVLQAQVPDTLSLDIEKTFVAIEGAGTSYSEFANDIIASLALQSGLMFNGEVDSGDYRRFLMYPDALSSSPEGKEIVHAIETAAKNKFKDGIAFYASDDTDSIKLYQLAAPFEIYKLNDLKDWEDNYFANYDELLHGLSPDVDRIETPGQPPKYVENTSWKDYPSIVPSAADPKKPDPVTGKISYEGQVRIKLAKMIKRARDCGVLYCKQENGGFRIYRVNCDKSIDWQLELTNLPRNELGLLPVGAELAEIIATENGTTLESISKPVELNQGGVLSMPHINEAAAWEYAERVLRAHMPMQIEVRNTVAKFETWYKIIEEENKKVLERLKPAKLIFILRSRMLYRDASGMWKIKLSSGVEKTVANFSDNGLRMLEMTDPKGAKLVKNGFSAYFLHTKLLAIPELKADGFDKVYQAARERLAELGMQGEEEALMAGIQMAAFVDEETAAINAIGGALADGEAANIGEEFILAMHKKEIDDEAMINNIRRFYIRTSMLAE